MDVMHIHRSKSRYQYGSCASRSGGGRGGGGGRRGDGGRGRGDGCGHGGRGGGGGGHDELDRRPGIFRIGIMDPWGIASSCRGRGDGGTGRAHGSLGGGGGGGHDELDRRPQRRITVVDFLHRHHGSVGWPEASGRARYMALALTQDRSNHWGLIMTMLAGWRKTWQTNTSSSTQCTFVVACFSPSVGFDCLVDP